MHEIDKDWYLKKQTEITETTETRQLQILLKGSISGRYDVNKHELLRCCCSKILQIMPVFATFWAQKSYENSYFRYFFLYFVQKTAL